MQEHRHNENKGGQSRIRQPACAYDAPPWGRAVSYVRMRRQSPIDARSLPLIGERPVLDARTMTHGGSKISVMEPGTLVRPHTGATNARQRIHLGLYIPKGVFVRVDGVTKTYAKPRAAVQHAKRVVKSCCWQLQWVRLPASPHTATHPTGRGCSQARTNPAWPPLTLDRARGVEPFIFFLSFLLFFLFFLSGLPFFSFLLFFPFSFLLFLPFFVSGLLSNLARWTEGKCIVFDDSFIHDVWHNGTVATLTATPRLAAKRALACHVVGGALAAKAATRPPPGNHSPTTRRPLTQY